MKSKLFCSALLSLAVLVIVPSVLAKAKEHESSKVVDSGSFGVYVRGQRVATETFKIEQGPEFSTETSEFKFEGEGQKANQTAELEVFPNGELRRYVWHSITPERAEEIVEPSEEFLIEHVNYDDAKKQQEIPYLLPHSTAILDDYFFSQREILAWRYIASACVPDPKQPNGCRLDKAQFGALIPRQHTSMPVSMEYAGKEKVTIHGVERELDRFNLHTENSDWALYLDDQYKLVRILIAAEQTEVVRD